MKSQNVCGALWVDHLFHGKKATIKLLRWEFPFTARTRRAHKVREYERHRERGRKREPLKALCNRKRIIAISARFVFIADGAKDQAD